MTKINKILIFVCLLHVSFNVAVSNAQDTSGKRYISSQDGTIDKWSQESAVKEAESDIENNKIKIYYSGTIAAEPVGVLPEDIHLIKDLPIADGGIGCIVTDSELREKQKAYANRYNEIVILHLKRSYNKSPLGTQKPAP